MFREIVLYSLLPQSQTRHLPLRSHPHARAQVQVLLESRMLKAIQPPTPLRDFDKSYTLLGRLGEGSNGTVFKAACIDTCGETIAADPGNTSAPRDWVRSIGGSGEGRCGSGASAAAASAAVASAAANDAPRYFAVKRIPKDGVDDEGKINIFDEVRGWGTCGLLDEVLLFFTLDSMRRFLPLRSVGILRSKFLARLRRLAEICRKRLQSIPSS